jgi:hypothetical protein
MLVSGEFSRTDCSCGQGCTNGRKSDIRTHMHFQRCVLHTGHVFSLFPSPVLPSAELLDHDCGKPGIAR